MSSDAPSPQTRHGQNRILITGAYGANPHFGAHTQPPILFQDHFYAHYTINERSGRRRSELQTAE